MSHLHTKALLISTDEKDVASEEVKMVFEEVFEDFLSWSHIVHLKVDEDLLIAGRQEFSDHKTLKVR